MSKNTSYLQLKRLRQDQEQNSDRDFRDADPSDRLIKFLASCSRFRPALYDKLGPEVIMDCFRADVLIKEIKRLRAESYDRTFAAQPGTTDPEMLASLKWDTDLVAIYDSLLAIYEG